MTYNRIENVTSLSIQLVATHGGNTHRIVVPVISVVHNKMSLPVPTGAGGAHVKISTYCQSSIVCLQIVL